MSCKMWDLRRTAVCFATFIIAHLIHIIHGASVVINPSGQIQSQPLGKGFGLTCQGEAENPDYFSQMKWTGPKGDIAEGNLGPVEVSRSGSALLLMFKKPTAEESGMYNCSAVYDSTEHYSAGVQIVFYQDITWEDCPQQQALIISSDGKISCRVSANPPAIITWSKDNERLPEKCITESDGVKIASVEEEDKGRYTVRAMVTQTGRFQSRTITVEVHVPPVVIELKETVEAVEGEETILNCQASGFPHPVYSWFDPKQRDLSEVDGFTVDGDTGSLTIRSVERANGGVYTCMAKNPAGEAKRNLDLNVIVKPEIKHFNNITSVENSEAVLECQATGEPLPEITIRKDGHDEQFSDVDDHYLLNRRNENDMAILTLSIQRIMRSDSGLYYCVAENKGAQVEKVGHITVEFAPVLSSTPSTSVKTWNDHPVNLTCIAEAIPDAIISWYFSGEKINDNNYYTAFHSPSHSNLLVKPPGSSSPGVSVYGTYKCEANNGIGTKHINIELQEAHRPGVLLQTTTEKQTATTITFKFHGPKNDGGLPIRAFVVKYQEESQSFDEAKQHTWSEGTTYILEDLKPRTTYKFRFAAKNDVGIGEWSEEKIIVMPAESYPEPPKFITPGSNVSSYPDRFEVRWTIPLDNGKTINYFHLRYFQLEKRNSEWKQASPDIVKEIKDWKYSPRYEITDLKPSSYYKVEVRAHNVIGFSQDATMIFRTAAGSVSDKRKIIDNEDGSSPLSTAAIAAIIAVLVLIILIILDVTCYLRYQWGLLYFFRSRVCGKPTIDDKAKEAAAEEGKGSKMSEESEEKLRTEVDNPAFDAKDSKPSDVSTDDMKNKSPKGSKSSIAKDSLV